MLLVAPVAVGCRLPGREGPVPQSLADCRRLVQRGAASLEHGRTADAETCLAQAVAICPVDSEARRHYAEALWRRGTRPEAIAQMEEAVRLAEFDAASWARLAEMQLAVGLHEQAARSAETAVELDRKLAAAWAVHGGVARATGRHADALADYLRALGQAPRDRAILLEVAESYRLLNQPQRALQTLQTLAETYPPGEEPGRVMYLMGAAQLAVGRTDDAVTSLSAAIARDTPTVEMYHQLAEAQFMSGHPTEAAAALQQALAMQPAHQPSRELLRRSARRRRSLNRHENLHIIACQIANESRPTNGRPANRENVLQYGSFSIWTNIRSKRPNRHRWQIRFRRTAEKIARPRFVS
jgi:tetratricopeptide (TPR) repeat protein